MARGADIADPAWEGSNITGLGGCSSVGGVLGVEIGADRGLPINRGGFIRVDEDIEEG